MSKIDVILPIFHPKIDDLENCLLSLNNQTFKSFILFVVEDPSEISTIEFEKKIRKKVIYEIVWIRNKIRKGLSESLNIGISSGSGEIIARVDVDDINIENRFNIQYNFLMNNSNVGIIGSWMNLKKKNTNKIFIRKYPLKNNKIKKHMIWYNPLAHPTVMFRRSIIKRIGLYDKDLKYLEDWDLWFKAIISGIIIENLSKCLVEYQIGNDSIVEHDIKNNIKYQIYFKNKYVKNFGMLIRINILLLKLSLLLPEKLIKNIYNLFIQKR